MIGIVVAAHGGLAQALVDTAASVLPHRANPLVVSIDTSDDAATYEKRLGDAVQRAENGSGVLVLTDMFGGTPSNVGMTMHHPGRVEVLTGVNLPMLIKALQLSGQDHPADLTEAARAVSESGQQAIAVATDILAIPPPVSEPEHTVEESAR